VKNNRLAADSKRPQTRLFAFQFLLDVDIVIA
jgi:hypothetical protein